MITFHNRLVINNEYEKWRKSTIPHPVPNVQTFLAFLQIKDLIDDELINAWCDKIERDEV